MNKFISLTFVQQLNKVTYYSVQLEEESTSFFENFVARHTYTNKEKLNHILAWIKVIGNKYGAYDHFFRNEANIADARALPPIGKDREPKYIEYNEETGGKHTKPNDLRLYCFRANESVVFLFDGDIKTAATPQECSNVKPHFDAANRITKILEQAFKSGTIKWNIDYTDIHFTNPIE